MSLARVAIGRPVGVTACAVALVCAGLWSAARLPVDLLPDLAFPELVVRVEYADAAPAEMERLVTEPVERAVAAVAGVERVASVAHAGLSLTTLRFPWGTDMDLAALAVRESLDEVRDVLPPAASRPAVLRADPSAQPLLAVVVSRRDPGPRAPQPTTADVRAPPRLAALRALGDLSDAVVRRRLEQLDGVAEATLTGVPDREIHVTADALRLASLGLTLDDVAGALASANQSAVRGTVRTGDTRHTLRALGGLASVEEIGRVPLRRARLSASSARARAAPAHPAVVVRDVATVSDGFAEPESVTRLDGRDAVGLLVHKEPDASAVQVARRVERVLADLRRSYPDVRFDVAWSQAGFVRGAIAGVAQEVVLGGVLAFAVLFLFVGDARVPVAIAVAIPVSLLVTLVLLDACGVSLNVMSLGGLALGVGLLMDNSIVVAENVLRLREQGMDARAAAAAGAEEMQSAIASSTLTTIAVFAPIAYVEGVAGRLFQALALSIAFALLASVLVALTLLPAMAARWRGARADGRRRSRVLRAFDAGFARFARAYERALSWALAHRARVVVACATLVVLAVGAGLSLERTAMPQVDEGRFRVRLALPIGTPLERTAVVAARLDSMLRRDTAVASVLAHVGRRASAGRRGDPESDSHDALLDVRLRAGHASAPVIARMHRTLRGRALADVSAHAWIDRTGTGALGTVLDGAEADVVVRVRARDPDAGAAYASVLAARLRGSASLADVRLASAGRRREVRVELDRARAASFGLDVRQVAHAVSAAVQGLPATELSVFERGVPVMVRLPDDRRRSLDALQALDVGGAPLREVAQLRTVDAATEVRREGHGRVATVLANVRTGGDAGLQSALADVASAVAAEPGPDGLRVEVGGRHREAQRSMRALGLAFLLALTLAFLILAAEFESLVQPLTVLLSVPLALVGAVLALWITGTPLSTVSLVGVVVLVGIVDNDAVVKVDSIIRLRAQGMSARDAVRAAGRARLRPIVINTVTASLGLVPMALGWGPGAELQAPLAITVLGGLLSATALTLVVIPVVYTLLDDARGAVARVRARLAPPQ